MPLVRSRVATVFVGRAPLSSQCFARSSSITISDGSGWGLYWPIVSIVRPSRGERWSATTTLQIGFFLLPTLRSLILTDMRRRRLDDGLPHAPHQRLRVGHLALGELLHQLVHLAELLDQAVDGLHGGPRSGRDALAPRAVDLARVGALIGRHREDDRLDPVDLPLVDLVHPPRRLPHAGHHLHQVAERAHAPHLLQLAEEVLERELLLADLALEVGRLVGVELLLSLLDQGHHVAHAEDPARHPVGVEALQLVELLAGRGIDDRLAGHLLYGEGGAT